jgi:hypothetical protein
LAKEYTVWTTNTSQACKDNCKVAVKAKRLDLAKLWMLCSRIAHLKITQDKSDPVSTPWSHHPLGKPLLKSMLDHCINTGDFQTSACILCCFWPLQTAPPPGLNPLNPLMIQSNTSSLTSSAISSPVHKSPYRTIHGVTPAAAKNETNNSKKPRFWFMKPGALPGMMSGSASPYHTIQLAVPSASSSGTCSNQSLKKDSDVKNKKNNCSTKKTKGLPYTTSDNNLQLCVALQKAHRSNSFGDACEEALGATATAAAYHYSPSNTVANIGYSTSTGTGHYPSIHVKDVWPCPDVVSSSDDTDSSVNTTQDQGTAKLGYSY